jgi:hypothetical protein
MNSNYLGEEGYCQIHFNEIKRLREIEKNPQTKFIFKEDETQN